MPDASTLESLLVCPRCHARLIDAGAALVCAEARCGFRAARVDGMVSFLPDRGGMFFDDHAATLTDWTAQPGVHRLFYQQQVPALASLLADAGVVLDVGCGPRLLYRRPPGLLIGVEPSAESLKRNGDVDLRLHGSVTELPLPPASVDAVLCFYSLHHMVGRSVGDNERMVLRALTELGRVLKPGGRLLVFDVSPRPLAWWLQRALWNAARRVLGARLDMFFWNRHALARLAERALPPGMRLRYRDFAAPGRVTFPPVFPVAWLRIPRLLYPFDICLYEWQCEALP